MGRRAVRRAVRRARARLGRHRPRRHRPRGRWRVLPGRLLGPRGHDVERESRAIGDPRHVVEFGLHAAWADLQADGLAVDLGLGPASRRRPPFGRQRPHPEGPGGVAEDLAQATGQGRVAQRVEGVAGSSLLHHHGGDPGVVGARIEQGRHCPPELFAGRVVEVGLEDGDRLARACRRPRRPPFDPRTGPRPPGCSWEGRASSWRAGAEAGGRHHHRRHRSERDGQGGQDGGPGRRGELHRRVPAVGGTPASRRTTAGEGLGSRPWAVRTMPVPVATAEATTASTPRTSRAAAVPTTSTIASCPPTSWKCTCSGGAAVDPPLDLGQGGERRPGPGGRPGRGGGPRRPAPRCGRGSAPPRRRCRRPRPGCRRPRPAAPARREGPATEREPSRRSSTSSRSAPASRRLPSAMSPAIPAKQWNQATVLVPVSASTAARSLTGGAGPRHRRRRSRCRCPRR